MSLAAAPKNLDDLFDGVSEVFADLRNSTIKPGIAKEMNNSAGKMVNIVKVKLEACALSKEAPAIPQLGKYKGPAKS
jgi:hypothetical protein